MCAVRGTEGSGVRVCLDPTVPRRHETESVDKGILRRGNNRDKERSIGHSRRLHLLCYDSGMVQEGGQREIKLEK